MVSSMRIRKGGLRDLVMCDDVRVRVHVDTGLSCYIEQTSWLSVQVYRTTTCIETVYQTFQHHVFWTGCYGGRIFRFPVRLHPSCTYQALHHITPHVTRSPKSLSSITHLLEAIKCWRQPRRTGNEAITKKFTHDLASFPVLQSQLTQWKAW